MRSQQGETDLWSQEGGARTGRAQKEKPEMRSQKEDIRNEEPRRRGQTCGQRRRSHNREAQKEKTGRRSQQGEIRNKEPRRINHE
jgi:hypothetical protein